MTISTPVEQIMNDNDIIATYDLTFLQTLLNTTDIDTISKSYPIKTQSKNNIHNLSYIKNNLNQLDHQNTNNKPNTDINNIIHTKNIHLLRSIVIEKIQNNDISNNDISNNDISNNDMINKYNLISFSPPKSYELQSYNNHIPDNIFNTITTIKNDNTYTSLEEYIDGTMINLFYIPSLQIWEISTKTYIGGKNNFYMNTTNDINKNNFRTLFYEALSFNSLTTDQLDTSLVYSFVLQHPQNKIIKHIDNPTLYLCAIYKIQHFIVQEFNIQTSPYIKSLFVNSTIKLPYKDERNLNIFKAHLFNPNNQPLNYSSISNSLYHIFNTYANSHYNTPFYIKGIIIRINNSRFKIYNPYYLYIKELKGNQAKMQYQYFVLLYQNRVHEFLNYFPEYTNQFNIYYQEFESCIQYLYSMYIDTHILKKIPYDNIPYEYKPHIDSIHHMYISSPLIKRKNVMKKPSIQRHDVQHYMYTLHPSKLMYTINYSKRSQSVK